MPARSLLAALALLCLWLAAGTAQAAGGARVALVVGNGAYSSVPRLANPDNDARLVARSLKAAGFTLIGGGARLDLDKRGFDAAVQQFGQAIQGADVALFYYSGHGLQVGDTNWLVPIDANPTRTQDLDFQMVDADVVLRQMSGAGSRLNILVLDACRNNPFGGRRLRATGGGLAQMRAPEGTMISYATQPGSVASDGEGRDSPFTLALVDAMGRPGLDVFGMFNRVGVTVKKSSGGQQQPWLSASPIEGDFYFVPAGAAPIPPPSAAETAALTQPLATAAPAPPQQRGAVPFDPADKAFRCQPAGTEIKGRDQSYDWSGDTVTPTRTTKAWSYKSLGSAPGDPATCLRSGGGVDGDGALHRLAGWFDTDNSVFDDDAGAEMLALEAGKSTEISFQYARRDTLSRRWTNSRWHLHGHETLKVGGEERDTLVFDVTDGDARNYFGGSGRVWYAPALKLFVRKIWQPAVGDTATGWTVTDVVYAGGEP